MGFISIDRDKNNGQISCQLFLYDLYEKEGIIGI